MKKFCILLLAFVLAFCTFGCAADSKGGGNVNQPDGGEQISGGSDDGNEEDGSPFDAPKGKPDFTTKTDEMLLGGWIGNTKIYEDTVKYASEAGLNFLNGYRRSNHFDKVGEYVGWVEKYGMKTFISMQGLDYPEDMDTSWFSSPSVLGLGFWDEPAYDDFDNLNTKISAFTTAYPNHKAFVNLFPNYAQLTNLRQSAEFPSKAISSEAKANVKNYTDYVNQFVSKVPVTQLSVDYYPLIGTRGAYDAQKSQLTFTGNSLADGWLLTLETNAIAAREANKDLWCCIQTLSFGADRRAPLGVSDITFQNYVSMCYGVNGIQYFTLDTPETSEFHEYDYGMLYKYSRDEEENYFNGSETRGKPSNIYNYVKEANTRLKSFDHAFLQFKWENCKPVYGAESNSKSKANFNKLNNPLINSDYFTATADHNALIGQFTAKDGSKYKGYMIANFSDPTENVTSTVTIEFNADKLLVFKPGEEEKVIDLEVTDGKGKYFCSLAPGAGEFVIPYYAA